MYLKEFEEIEVEFKTKYQQTIWSKKIGFTPPINEPIKIHWTLLKGTTFRTLFINVKCDDCDTIYKRRIRDLCPEKNIHYCYKCFNKGERNGMYGISQHENAKKGIEKWREKMKKEGKSLFSEYAMLRSHAPDTNRKRAEKNRGKKRTKEVKKRQSESALLAFKEGRRVPCKRWGKTIIKQYNGIDYQSSYELKFLKLLESLGLLNYIERGPTIEYFDKNGKSHSYFIDYKLKNSNYVFEIKSNYTWKKNLEINLIKKEAAQNLYNYILIIDNRFYNAKRILLKYAKKI